MRRRNRQLQKRSRRQCRRGPRQRRVSLSPSIRDTPQRPSDAHAPNPRPTWRFATWNVRTMLQDSGPAEATRAVPTLDGLPRKAELVLDDLEKRSIDVGAVQETRWWDKGEYDITSLSGKRWTYLSSGCPEQGPRIGGVGVFLSAQSAIAWKSSGGRWKAVSSRVAW